jgi:amino acid permease
MNYKTRLLKAGFTTTIGAGFTTTTLATGVAGSGRVCTMILLAGVLTTILLWAFVSKTLENAILKIKMNFFIMCIH